MEQDENGAANAAGLTNLATALTQSQRKLQRSTLTNFNEFLVYMRANEPDLCAVNHYSQIADGEFFTIELIGKFPTFMLQKKGLKGKVINNYCCSMYMLHTKVHTPG